MAKNVYIQFPKDTKIGEAYYTSRAWYLVPEKLAKRYVDESPGRAIDVRDEFPGEDSPVGDSVRSESAPAPENVPSELDELVEGLAEEAADDDAEPEGPVEGEAEGDGAPADPEA